MKHKVTFLVFLFICASSISQNLNNYKYIIIPNQYDFLKGKDQYKLNSLTKFLFEKENFTVLYEDDKMPTDLYEKPCLGLHANVSKSNSIFTIIVEVKLTDCHKKVIFTSIKGKSKIKDYKRGYHEALRKAFISFKNLNYTFKQTKNTVVTEPKVVKDISNKEVSLSKTTKPNSSISYNDKNIFYAQKTKNGFQLVDNTPKIIYTLLTTSKSEVYILKNKKGYLYKMNHKWFIEYYEKDNLITKILNIKF